MVLRGCAGSVGSAGIVGVAAMQGENMYINLEVPKLLSCIQQFCSSSATQSVGWLQQRAFVRAETLNRPASGPLAPPMACSSRITSGRPAIRRIACTTKGKVTVYRRVVVRKAPVSEFDSYERCRC
jgi:hypothetical protein